MWALVTLGAGAALVGASGLASRGPALDLHLDCRGRAEAVEYGPTDYVTGEEAVVKVQFSDGSGMASLPRLIGGGNHKSLKIKDIEASQEEVKGEVWYGRIGNAKMRIDRQTGLISIRGPKGNFSGTCTPYDPAEPSSTMF